MMQVFVIPVTPFFQNCTILRCEQTGKSAVVDPGGEIERILEAARQNEAEIEKILVTHGHIDHVGGVADLADRLKVPVEGPQREDQFWIDALPQQSKQFEVPSARPFVPDRWLEQGDIVSFGNIELKVHHCPGHTPGHVIFFQADLRLAFVGDVLFKGSIGRTDFPRGDYATLIQSIRLQLWPLGDDITFIPGHGPASTLGEERRTNPFVADDVS
jgi:hydroxyacylglutathione hydrolase